jgi:peptidoglycan/xylan/chitin deacetylase (PgdA/CDA1 family)
VTRLAILGYHKVGPPAPGGWETWYYVPESVFADQIAAIRESGWVPIDVAALLRALSGRQSLPERAALVTFDDGYRSMLELALPVLQRHECSAVLFVPTAFVGRTNEFDRDDEPEERICDWSELAELARAGVSIQSHGVSHRTFSELSGADRRREIVSSKSELESKLGARIDLFAYPYGDDAGGDPDVRAALLESGYHAAFGYGGDPLRLPTEDPYRLERVAMGADTDLRALLRVAENRATPAQAQ